MAGINGNVNSVIQYIERHVLLGRRTVNSIQH